MQYLECYNFLCFKHSNAIVSFDCVTVVDQHTLIIHLCNLQINYSRVVSIISKCDSCVPLDVFKTADFLSLQSDQPHWQVWQLVTYICIYMCLQADIQSRFFDWCFVFPAISQNLIKKLYWFQFSHARSCSRNWPVPAIHGHTCIQFQLHVFNFPYIHVFNFPWYITIVLKILRIPPASR